MVSKPYLPDNMQPQIWSCCNRLSSSLDGFIQCHGSDYWFLPLGPLKAESQGHSEQVYVRSRSWTNECSTTSILKIHPILVLVLRFHFYAYHIRTHPTFSLRTLDVTMTSLWHHLPMTSLLHHYDLIFHLWPHFSPPYPTTTSSIEHYKYDSIS